MLLQMYQLEENLKLMDPETLRDRALIALMAIEGLRREDTLSTLDEYLTVRGSVDPDRQGEPLFISIGKGGKPGGRLSRIGVNHVVDTYLVKAGLKRPGISRHALRHTCGHLLYQATRDPKVVQETLRHSSITTAGQYSHTEERSKARHTRAIPVKME